jgi:hypothetical protein
MVRKNLFDIQQADIIGEAWRLPRSSRRVGAVKGRAIKEA